MTEAEWLTAPIPFMLKYIRDTAPATARKLRLLAVAYGRFLETQPDYSESKHVSHLGEEVAEGRLTLEEAWDRRAWDYHGDWAIANVVLASEEDGWLDGRVRAVMRFSEVAPRASDIDTTQRPVIARAYIRCIFGNPFRPVAVDPSWLTSTVVQLTKGIYDDRAFDRMPILADTLQDAGCDNPDVLNHCRSDTAHARGCWVVDLVLGKM